jgi:RNA polymerase sigma-70 factor (ECF subfamily)
MWIECEGDRITAIHALRHPAKLAHLMPVADTSVTKPAAYTSLH